MRNMVGGVPTGEDFFDREDIVQEIWHRLDTDNILLVAPRRFGKTGIMFKLKDDPKDDFVVCSLDCEGIETPSQLVVEMAYELAQQDRLRAVFVKAKGLAGGVVSAVRDNLSEISIADWKIKLNADVKKSWEEEGRALLNEMRHVDGKVAIVLDELPMMIENMLDKPETAPDVARFLEWFRKIRLRQDGSFGNIRFVIGGSVGLDHIVRKITQDDPFNDLCRIEVPPFDGDTAREFLDTLAEAEEIELSDGARKAVLELVGPCVPFYLQLIFSQLCQRCDESRRVTKNMVEDVYRSFVLGPTCRYHFSHYEDRLRRYGKPTEQAAKAVLKALARAERMSASSLYNIYARSVGDITDGSGFEALMADLETDFYIRPTDGGFVFASKILRDWWLRWHVSYEPDMQEAS